MWGAFAYAGLATAALIFVYFRLRARGDGAQRFVMLEGDGRYAVSLQHDRQFHDVLRQISGAGAGSEVEVKIVACLAPERGGTGREERVAVLAGATRVGHLREHDAVNYRARFGDRRLFCKGLIVARSDRWSADGSALRVHLDIDRNWSLRL